MDWRRKSIGGFRVESVDEVVFAKSLDKWLSIHRDLRVLYREAEAQGLSDIARNIRNSMKTVAGRFMRNGKTGFVVRAKSRGLTESVLHLIFDNSGRLDHLGIEGVRGWDLFEPGKVEFRLGDKRFQFDHISYGLRRDRWRVKK